MASQETQVSPEDDLGQAYVCKYHPLGNPENKCNHLALKAEMIAHILEIHAPNDLFYFWMTYIEKSQELPIQEE